MSQLNPHLRATHMGGVSAHEMLASIVRTHAHMGEASMTWALATMHACDLYCTMYWIHAVQKDPFSDKHKALIKKVQLPKCSP